MKTIARRVSKLEDRFAERRDEQGETWMTGSARCVDDDGVAWPRRGASPKRILP
jgi:hypothetical protein